MRIRSIAALVGLVALVAACSAGPGTGGELQGTKWILRSYDNAGTLTLVPENQYADIEFDSNRATGFSGCNTFNARYRSGGRTLFTGWSTISAGGAERRHYLAATPGDLEIGVLLPVAGTWRLFIQTKVAGKVLTAPFTLTVQ